MPTTDPMPEDFHVYLAQACSRFSRLAIRRADVGVSSVAWRITSMLDERGPMRLSEIALHDQVSRPTMTTAVQRLEDAEILVRRQDPTDSRSWLVDLTDTGREHLATWRGRLSGEVRSLISDLGPGDIDTLRRAADILHRLIGNAEGTSARS